jgi:hypothetical protein
VWLLTELAADGDEAYGICDVGVGTPELGTIRLSALENMVGPRGIAVVADPHFVPRQALSAYFRDAVRDGAVND